jgi:hypothetical protein
MADGVLFIGRGLAVAGREQKAVQVFGEAVQYCSTVAGPCSMMLLARR